MNETIDKLIPLFEKVAAKIGEGAAFGWDVVLRQQYVYAVQYGIGALVGLVMLGVGVSLIRRGRRHQDGDDIFVGYIVATMGTGALVIFIPEVVGRLINPGYYALEFFINLAK